MERNSNSAWLPPWTRLEHEARYAFVAQFVAGKRVVDCACGTGIGSILFASRGAVDVRAIDSSNEAVREAMSASDLQNLHISRGDATKLDLPDNFADVFVSLETIEHLQDDAALVDEAYRVLKPGGIFICSTPNRELTNPGTSIRDKPWNPFHVREYDPQEFRACLERKFSIEGVYGQNPVNEWSASARKRLASLFGTALVIKLNKLLKCRWFLLPAPKRHAVRPTEDNKVYEFYVIVGRVPLPKN